MFDTIHDQTDPSGVLERIHAALAPRGVFVMKEPRLSSNLEGQRGNPFAPMTYAVSTLHCMTISLAEGGTGLGTAFGEQLARRKQELKAGGESAVLTPLGVDVAGLARPR